MMQLVGILRNLLQLYLQHQICIRFDCDVCTPFTLVCQGFGRVSLKNILPYAGIEDNLYTIITESSITAGTRITYTVSVSSSTLPLKATLVWMDPTNSIITTKMLLNDLDLQVRYVPSSTMYYGNGIQRDEYNNVSSAFYLILFIL